jgi:O-methyltransferase/aklanonic acid methyltransferase
VNADTAKTKDVIPGVFSRHALPYRDRVAGALSRHEARGRLAAYAALALEPGERVVDLGCGPGTLTFAISAAVGASGHVVGVDLADGMLRLARAGAPPNVSLARMDMERLGFQDARFDAAVCGHALQFCPDLPRALTEVRRILRPGGRFAASLPGRTSPPPGLRLRELFSDLLPPAPAMADTEATAEATGSAAHLLAVLVAAGFDAVRTVEVDEPVTYRTPEEMIDKSLTWWELAWRLESVPAERHEPIRAEAVARLRARTGDGPIQIPGTNLVASGRRP